MRSSGKIVLFDMDEDDAELLLTNVPDSDHSRENQDVNHGRKGELTTALIVLGLTAAALKAWVAYLALKAQKSGYQQDFEIIGSNGELKRGRIVLTASKGHDLQQEIITQLTDLGIDKKLLVQ